MPANRPEPTGCLDVDLSIIIVNWNTAGLLRDCLASVPAACGDLEFEIIVVDNLSSDGSAAMVATEFPEVRLLAETANHGFARGNNLALPLAEGRFVLLLNPDTICPPDSLQRLVSFAIQKERLAVVGPRLTDRAGAPTITWGRFPAPVLHWREFLDPWRRVRGMRDRLVHVPTRQEPSRTVDYVAGACFLMPRSALETVGPLDERFFLYFEETDWCWRASQLDLDVWYCAETEIIHLEGQAAELASRFSLMQLQKSYRLFVAKNYGKGRVWQFRLAQFAEYSMKSLVRRLMPGDRERNRRLASVNGMRAKLQLRGKIEADPPVSG